MYLKIVAISLLVLAAQHITRLAYLMGYHVTNFNHEPGPCKAVPGIECGAEDIETTADGLAFITTGLKNKAGRGTDDLFNKDEPSRIMLFDFNKPFDEALHALTVEEPYNSADASYHGISLYENPSTGVITLFVINHLKTGEHIEKFQYNKDTNTLKYLDDIDFPQYKGMTFNDVVAVNENSFYYSKMYATQGHFLNSLETYLMLPWGSVLYYDGKSHRSVATGFWLANGLNISPDKKYLYVNALSGFKSYQILPDGSLEFVFAMPLMPTFASDNLYVERDSGNVWTAGQSCMHQAVKHLTQDSKELCDSKVLRYSMSDGVVALVTEVYSNNGTAISCSSAANYYKGKLLIGSVYDKLLYCHVKSFEP